MDTDGDIELYDVIYWVDTPLGERKRVHHPAAGTTADRAVEYVRNCIVEAGHTPVRLASCTVCTGTRS